MPNGTNDTPWEPMVYIMRCRVNKTMLQTLEALRGRPSGDRDPFRFVLEPRWLADIRFSRTMDAGLLGRMKDPFETIVKVGSTYQARPENRPGSLMNELAPNETMICRGIPLVGTEVLVWIPGEQYIERALHKRWDFHRIDPSREFFWLNREMSELITESGRPANKVLPVRVDDLPSNQAEIVTVIAQHFSEAGATKAEIKRVLDDVRRAQGRPEMGRGSYALSWEKLVVKEMVVRIADSQRWALSSVADA